MPTPRLHPLHLLLVDRRKIRRIWDAQHQKWYFRVQDVLKEIFETSNPRRMWLVLKRRLTAEGFPLDQEIRRVKIEMADRKYRWADLADHATLFRIFQSSRTPRAESVKRTIAEMAAQWLEENRQPERAIQRAAESYLERGYPREWVSHRLQSLGIRQELTRFWATHGIRDEEYRHLTEQITASWSGMQPREYRLVKHIGGAQSLRDHMTSLELVVSTLAETATLEVARAVRAYGLPANLVAARRGGEIARQVRAQLEKYLAHSIVTQQNFLSTTQSPR